MSSFSRLPKDLDLIGHLGELRQRLVFSLVFFLFALILLFSCGNAGLTWLERPAQKYLGEMVFLSPTQAFTAYFKIVTLEALIVSFPFILYQFWMFLVPAVDASLRRTVLVWLWFALLSFSAGLFFAYYIILPAALDFLMRFSVGIARPMISISEYISFTVTLLFAGGMAFEVPIIIGLLTQANIVSSDFLCRARRQAFLVNLIAAAVITPTQDVFSLLVLAVPMVILYEVGIIVARKVEKEKIKIMRERGLEPL